MEITVVSAHGLKTSSLFSRRLRPFITITTYPPPAPSDGDKECHVYSTRVDDQGGLNPSWGDKFFVPIDHCDFLANRFSYIHLELYTKRLIMGPAQLGWCRIPVTDIGFPPEGSVRNLSYRIRAKDGTRGHGVVNLAIKLTGFQPVIGYGLSDKEQKQKPNMDTCQTVIGIPATMLTCKSIYQ